VATRLAFLPALRRRFSRYGRHYRRFLIEVHYDVDFKGLVGRGLSMDQIFVGPGLVPQRSIWECLRDAPLALIGAPGGGKTTLLKHMTLVMARNRRAGWLIGAPRHKTPILLFLRDHAAAIAADPHLPLAELVRTSARPSGAKEPPQWFDKQLDAGRCVVLLDGLDEVGRQPERRLVVAWVAHQLAVHPHCPFVLTGRGDPPLGGATVLRIEPFTPAQTASFVSGWYLAAERSAAGRDDEGVRLKAADGASNLLERLPETPEARGLAANPLLLTMLANVHRQRGTMPRGRTELYRETCRVLLGNRREAVGAGGDLTADQKETVLQVLALYLSEHRIHDLSRTEAADVIAPSLASVRPQMDANEFLEAIADGSGLILERENGLYCFAHHTMQEYLAGGGIRGRAAR
jgi:predicted NACHT family NTPase